MRVLLRVKPGASRTAVGGQYDGGAGPGLIVAVGARAVEGQATKAVLDAVATAFGVRRSAVTLVHGATSRDKLVEVDGDDVQLGARLAELLG
ncbi:hypothetical protein GCM10029976_007100 [Kribbella albertanoniae]|uniref:UPF0235 protein E1261_14700 n=1 Tax=Kribbella albertanoniae TaxID=1266829 RepID=A0A4R4Q4M8_9ACTN|nr:DUF167 domain-containing protein [Kribbella albertanoniae]TDC29879.1 DUF167 domain-containing protein [Kribbella albertanoniae]